MSGLVAIGDDIEGPWKLPDGWVWAELQRVLPLSYGKALAATDRDPSGDFPVFGSSGQVGLHSVALAPANAIIVGRKGSAGSVYFSQEPSWPIDTAYFTVGSAAVDARYAYWFLTHSRLDRMDNSTAIPSLSRDRYNEQLIALAPAPEQRRIVERIDELFAEIAEGEAALAQARKGLDLFRRSLLKAAVTGELTRDWRAANRPSETGDQLLARVRSRRRSHATEKSRGRRAHDEGGTAFRELPELPEGWVWTALGKITDIVGGITVDQKRRPDDPVTAPYLRVANVQRGHIDWTEIKTILVERSAALRLNLLEGDILLNEGGDRDKIGRGWVWDGSIQGMIHQNHVFRARPCCDGVNPFFISHYANEMGRRFFLEQGKQTTNLASISLSKLSQLPVPLPPAAEADEILTRMAEALDAADDAARELDGEAADAARLKQSILKAAFEGRLVPQNPADEPASALLARLATPLISPRRRGRPARELEPT